ncbi:MAG: HAMP domain-containing histidine kinase [Bdellovibrionaceae bacterium]|nr:HAMP domain-containing histidine kinase [Pseudobdellovibrionaceae bacterium]
MRNKVFFLLVVTLLVVGILPVISNYFLLNDILATQEKIYINADLSKSLLEYEASLKKLSKFDPESEVDYKKKFEDIQGLKLLYGEDTYFSEAVRSSTIKYFFILFGAGIVFSLVAGAALSIKVNRIYLNSFDGLVKEKERSLFLNEIAKWQEVAQKIAHEIRRPIQPIRIWLSQLKKQSNVNSASVSEAICSIEEEILFLSNMVNEFSDFANVPKPKMEIVEFSDFMQNFVSQYQHIWENTYFKVEKSESKLFVMMDVKLFRTLLTNLVENAVEANLNQPVNFTFSLSKVENRLIFNIFNSGVELDKMQRERVFEIYYSTKTSQKNRGLGLAIVKTVVLEHDGDIQCVESIGGAKFEIQLPLQKEKI